MTETDTKGSPPHNCMCAPRRTELPDKRRNKIRGFASRLGGGGVGDGGVGGEGGGGVGGGGVGAAAAWAAAA